MPYRRAGLCPVLVVAEYACLLRDVRYWHRELCGTEAEGGERGRQLSGTPIAHHTPYDSTGHRIANTYTQLPPYAMS
eukprot:3269733-Rhodomonas_salina.1